MKRYLPGEDYLIMTREQVRAFDSWAINELGIPGDVLMENAGRSCAELVMKELDTVQNPRVCIFCGTGNNGGDGYVIARHLLNKGFEVRVVLCGDRGKVKGDAKTNLDVFTGLGQPIETLDLSGDISNQIKTAAEGADMLIDALFGTGLQGRLRDNCIELINTINALSTPTMAVDIPSGLDCDTGELLGTAVRADDTVTFVAVKKGFTAPAAKKYTGRIYVASIGVEPHSKEHE